MWVAALLFIAILVLLIYLDTRKPRNFPPGPAWLPIIGSALEIEKYRRKTGYLAHATYELSKQYGPVLGLRIGQDKQVVCHSAEAVKQMLSEEDISGRPNGFFYQARTWEKRRGLLFTDEDFWHEQRRFVVRHLREFGFGRRDMGGLLEEEAQDLVRNIEERMNNNKSVKIEMNEVFNISVLNALWTMLAGTRYSPVDKTLKTLQDLLSDLFKSIDIVGCLFSQYPFLRFVAPEFSGYTRYINTHEHIWSFLRNELEHHKKTIKPGEPRDLMDVYLETLDSTDKSSSFSENQLLAICLDLFMAGSETTNKSLAFAFLYLVLYPEVQKKAQEEIDLVVGKERSPALSDRNRMPYIEALIYESLRMFVGHTLVLPRRALRDTTLQGYFIPKDTLVAANMLGIMMDEEIWGDPKVFRPERFIVDGKVHVPQCFLPFGLGKRRCMGETLAKANIFLFITSMLQKFTFTIPPGDPRPSTDIVDGVTPAPKPFSALVSIRY